MATSGREELIMLYFHNMRDIVKIWNVNINEVQYFENIMGFKAAGINYTLV